MRPAPRYPVDRYLVESSNKIEMVNIIDDEIWNPEPALRPEDEIMLRKLHEMLQSTADDLKLLSGELARRREPPTQVRAPPAPLDDDFNEKVHIEQVVNAKFHGYKIVDKTPLKTETKINKPQTNTLKTSVQTNTIPIHKKPTVTKRLTKSRTNIVQIRETKKQDKVEDIKKTTKETVAYNEFAFEYPKPKVESPVKGFQVQVMPSINIRSELKEQKVLHLDIVPDSVNSVDKTEDKLNVAVIAMQHDEPVIKAPSIKVQKDHTQISIDPKQPARKVTKMVTCESSTSTNNVSSDPPHKKVSLNKNRVSPRKSNRLDRSKIKNNVAIKTEQPKRTHLDLEEWKKKLNSVYGQPSGSRKNLRPKGSTKKQSPKKTNVPSTKPLNNAQYIPYSQLTLGGVSVSDIEREISNIPNKNNMPLSPILDRIISSRENSQQNSPRKNAQRDQSKILTTSDENLLQEVIDIENTVSKTLSKNAKSKIKEAHIITSDSTNDDTNEPESYADDFEDDKSDKSDKNSPTEKNITSPERKTGEPEKTGMNVDVTALGTTKYETNAHNITYSKVPSLSLKNSVDIFEYVHSVDTQDEATQSKTTNKISLKETQTSPRSGSPNMAVQPIHNDLWPSMDPCKKVEEMFKLEKDLIKKVIMDEYGDLLQRSIDKPSASKDNQESLNSDKNVAASQKVTQTSPKHVKSVMTSPAKMKTRTTSPFLQTLAIDHKTSPIVFVTDEKEVKVEMEQDPEDPGISINLSSPRFTLRLPNTSVEVLSNLEIRSRSPSNVGRKTDRNKKKENSVRKGQTVRNHVSSSTSIDADNSSSDISSLGEIKLKLKKRLRKNRVSSASESSSSSKLSVDLNSISILPLRSEGEVSLSQRARSRNASTLPSESDGELSLGNR